MARQTDLEDEELDQQAPADNTGDDTTSSQFESPDQEVDKEAADLQATNDQRTADEIAEAQALDKEEPPVASDNKVEDKNEDQSVEDTADTEESEKENPVISQVDPATLATLNAIENKKELSPLEKKKAMFDTYQQLLAQQRKDLNNAALLQAGSKIAQGMAMKYGGNPGENTEGVQMMQNMARQPMQDYLQNQLNMYRSNRASLADAQAALANAKTAGMVDLNDPKSDRSRALQAIAAKQYMAAHPNANPEDVPDFSTTSGADLLKMGTAKPGGLANQKLTFKSIIGPDGKAHMMAIDPTTGTPVKDMGVNGLATRYRVDPTTGNIVGYNGAGFVLPPANAQVPGSPAAMPPSAVPAKADESPEGDDTTTPTPKAPPEITMDQLRNTNNRQANFVQDQAKSMLKDPSIRALRTLGSKENNLAAKLDGFKKDANGNAVIDSGMQTAIATQAAALSMGGVPPESVIKEFGGAGGIAARMKRLMANNASGIMTQDDINFFKKYSNVMRGALEKSASDNSQAYITQVVNQFPPGTMTRENAAKLLGVSDLVPSSSTASSNNLVTVRGPSGQTVLMNPDKAKKYLAMPGYSVVQ